LREVGVTVHSRASVAVLGDAIPVVGYDDSGEAGYLLEDCRERWHPAGRLRRTPSRDLVEWNNQFTNVHVGASDAEHALEASPI
jgi:hypothetical protein